MITFFFDTNRRSLIQAPGNQAPAAAMTWVYGDNYNMQVYMVANGNYSPILATDTLTAILWQSTTPVTLPPQQQLATIGTPTILQDANGNSYFLLNVNLRTTPLANLVQAVFLPAQTLFHFLFNPTDLERFSQSSDIAVTVNPDPFLSATGANPVPPGYPINPSSVFEYLTHKGAVSGYAPLDGGALVPAANLPLATLPAAPGINYPADGTTIGVIGNTLKVISAGGNGDMLQAQYDDGKIHGGAPNLIIEKAANVMIGGAPQTCGTAATFNVPPSGNATAGQIVLGSDTRLALATPSTPGVIQPDNVTLKQVSNILKAVAAVAGALGTGSLGTVQPDGVTSTVDSNGILSIPFATNAAKGIVQPDNSTITITGGIIKSATGVPAANVRAHRSTNQTIPTTGLTAVSFDTLDFQNGATWITVPGSQFLVPVNGIYHIGANVNFSSGSGTLNTLFIAIGASFNTTIAQVSAPQSASAGWGACVDTIYSLTSGQILQVGVIVSVANLGLVNNGGSPSFWAYRIG